MAFIEYVIDYDFVKKELEISATELCYIISNHSDIDGQTFSFSKAFDKIKMNKYIKFI